MAAAPEPGATAVARGSAGRAVKPALLTVDDDPGVVRAVRRDLRRRYGDRYQVLAAESGAAALEIVKGLTLRGRPVAMFLVDQRMPQMSGVEFLEQAMQRAPGAKRVLLTAYADTQAAIRAINGVSLDYYLTKPWDPPEEQLYPVVDDLLDDWAHPAAWESDSGVRVVGHRWSRESHETRDFLTRNQVPHRWLDIERDAEARRLLDAAGLGDDRLPVAFFPDGVVAANPSNRELAERLEMTTQAGLRFYDLIIVGGGPAGLAAAVYGASEGLTTVLVEREAPGGQAGQSSRIENYLGFPTGLSGADLSRRAITQAQRLGAEVLAVQEAAAIEARGPARVVRLVDGTELSSHAVLVATGVTYRRLAVPGVEELSGRGIYYGAARSEALSCRDEEIFVIGGANSAGQAAIYFAKFASSVTILYRGDSLARSMSRYLIDQIEATPTIRIRTEAEMVAAHGDGHLEAITVRDRSGEERVEAQGVFVFIGADPHTAWLGDEVARDERGFVYAGPDLQAVDGAAARRWPLKRDPYLLETSMPGVFAAGDVRHQSIKRVASAVGEGSMAVQFVHQYLGLLP